MYELGPPPSFRGGYGDYGPDDYPNFNRMLLFYVFLSSVLIGITIFNTSPELGGSDFRAKTAAVKKA